MSPISRELVVILAAMSVFLLLSVVAVWLFVRQWRRERRGVNKKMFEDR